MAWTWRRSTSPETRYRAPWGNEYKYFSPGTHSDARYELVSLGSDGKEGGEGHAADIKSWELE